MKPTTPSKESSLPAEPSEKTLDIENDHIPSTTPRKNKPEITQAGTASQLELTPLVSPARLGWNRALAHQTYRLEIVLTPIFHRTNIMPYIDQYGFDVRQPHEIQARVLFGDNDLQESEIEAESHEESEFEKENQSNEESMNMDSKQFEADQVEEKNPSSDIDFKRTALDSLQDSEEDSNPKKVQCKCKRTQCIKLYCDCFRDGEMCGQSCQCSDCHNTLEFDKERKEVMRQILKRNPDAFDPKIEDSQHSKGCNCKKTGCMKKYCECYQAGLQCGQHCKCEECKNGMEGKSDFSHKEQKFRIPLRKQRRIKEYL